MGNLINNLENFMQRREDYIVSSKLKERLQFLFNKYKFKGEFEDFLADYQLDILEGKAKKQTLEQWTIDQIRKNLGRSGQKTALESASSDNLVKEHQADIYLSDLEMHMSQTSGIVRAVSFLICKYGLTLKEVGEVFGVTESRVCQIIGTGQFSTEFGDFNEA